LCLIARVDLVWGVRDRWFVPESPQPSEDLRAVVEELRTVITDLRKVVESQAATIEGLRRRQGRNSFEFGEAALLGSGVRQAGQAARPIRARQR